VIASTRPGELRLERPACVPNDDDLIVVFVVALGSSPNAEWRTTQEKAVARRTAQKRGKHAAQESRAPPFRRGEFGCSRSTRSGALRKSEATGPHHSQHFPAGKRPLWRPKRSSNALALDGKEARGRVREAPRPRAHFPIRSRTPSRANRCSRAAFSRRKMPRNSGR
jgi:hypothetical protein